MHEKSITDESRLLGNEYVHSLQHDHFTGISRLSYLVINVTNPLNDINKTYFSVKSNTAVLTCNSGVLRNRCHHYMSPS